MKRSADALGVKVSLCGLAFLVLLSYAISGTAAQSLFLKAYGNAMMPWAWLAVAVAAAASTAAVNHAARSMQVVPLFVRTSLLSAAILLLLLVAELLRAPGAVFALFVWKDVYVVILVELFWTFANVAYAVNSASAAYGWFCAAGSVGAVAGSLALGPLAQRMGTVHTLWLTLPVLLAVAWGCRQLGEGLELPMPVRSSRSDWRAGVAVLRQSSYLGLLLLLVATVQVTVTVLDFQFSRVLEAAYPDLDERTGVLGDVTAAINAVSFVLQIATQPLLRVLGVRGTLLGLPLILAGAVLAFVAAPRFATMTALKMISKCADYSMFRTSKEILYIPLSYAEKTQGKALVDMFTYRVAKAGASLLVLALGTLGAGAAWLNGANFLLCGAWLGLTVPIVARYGRALASQPAKS